MLCPLCDRRGGEKVGEAPPFERWRCRHCGETYPVYEGYPVHPEAVAALVRGEVRCPACGQGKTEPIPDAPMMGRARAFRCQACEAIFPALQAPEVVAGAGEAYLPVHPRAMIERVTGVQRLPSFFGLQQRLREYVEQLGFTVVRTEDKLDLDTQVREFTFYYVPDDWVRAHPERAQAVQGTLSFHWHAGPAQYAGAPPESASQPVPVLLGLGAVINPEQVTPTLAAYLLLVDGLGQVVRELGLDEVTTIDAQLAVDPKTEQARIRHLGAARHLTLDLREPDQWAALIGELPRQRELLERIYRRLAQGQRPA